MARCLKQIGFQYSDDDGATWSAALVLECPQVDIWKETFTKLEIAGSTGREWETKRSYIMVDIKFDERQFDPSDSSFSNQAANWLALQDWCAGTLRRIYNADTTNYPTFNSYTTFNVNPNTNYLNMLKMGPHHERIGNQFGATPELIRWFMLNLKTRDRV